MAKYIHGNSNIQKKAIYGMLTVVRTLISRTILGFLIRLICITILYHNLLLFIDIFHIMDMILMLFPLFCMYDDYEGNDCRSQNLMEKATSRHHIYEDQKLREKLYYGVLHQKTEVAKRRRPGGPQGARTCPRRGWTFLGAPGQGEATLAHFWPSHFPYFILLTEKP